jgi:hypothetical protein
MPFYDDKETEIVDKAVTMLSEIDRALANGTKHYRVSDGKLLKTPKEIVQALLDEGEIQFEVKSS